MAVFKSVLILAINGGVTALLAVELQRRPSTFSLVNRNGLNIIVVL